MGSAKLTKPTINGAKLEPALEAVGRYRSPPGGAAQATVTEANRLLFELITEGAVYAPEGEGLYGAGTIFAHHPGQHTVSRTEGDAHYSCMTARFVLDRIPRDGQWLRFFQWGHVDDALRFSEEMLLAFHHTNMDRHVLGDLILSQFRFRLEAFRQQANRQSIPPHLASILAHMEKNYAKDLSMEELAAQAGLSASHLHALFREHVGTTPHQHVIHQRMRAARHKLVTTLDPIKSVAMHVGYANTENFCRAFKKHCGLTAAAYRRKFTPHR